MNILIIPEISKDKSKEKSRQESPVQIFHSVESSQINASIYLKLFYGFFNMSYWFLLIPFRFKYNDSLSIVSDKNKEPISLKSGKIRKVLAVLVWLFSLDAFVHFQFYIFLNSSSRKNNVLLYFHVVHSIVHVASYAQVGLNLIFRQESYLKIMLAIGKCGHQQYKSRLKEKYLTWLIYLVTFILLCGTPALYVLETVEQSDWNWDNAFEWMLNAVPPYKYYRNDGTGRDRAETQYYGGFSLTYLIFGSIPPLAWIPHRFLEAFRICTYLFHGMMLNSAVHNFVSGEMNRDCEGDSPHREQQLLRNYQNLNELAVSINEAWGWTFFTSLVDYILWFTTDLNTQFQEDAWISRIVLGWYSLGMISLMIFSAEAARKMSEFKVWVIAKGPTIFKDNQEQTKFLTALEIDGIWIGKHGLYKVNYGFLGQVVVLLITLFIITLQYDVPGTQV